MYSVSEEKNVEQALAAAGSWGLAELGKNFASFFLTIESEVLDFRLILKFIICKRIY